MHIKATKNGERNVMKHIANVVSFAIIAVILGAVLNFVASCVQKTPEPVSVTLDISSLLIDYDADAAEAEWQLEFGGMSDEERLFGAVGEPEIIH